MCKLPALVLWSFPLPLVLATCHTVCHSSSFAVTGIILVPACFPVHRHRFRNMQREQIVQITETVLSEPVEIRRFIQQAVDHWPRLLAVHFTLHSTEGNRDEGQIHEFFRAFYRQLNQRSHAGYPLLPVVLRWLLETTESTDSTGIRCLLLISQDLICPPGSGMTSDDADSHLVGLLQQAGSTLTPEGQCTVVCCYRVVRAATPEGAESLRAFRNTCLSLARPVRAGIIR
ncbi:hypothetical protein [Escherichia coli]|uniref:hypothetical protein n=1 Tax=Escherichia coli TaxID=562 RepID=UPI00193C1203|nr:hypothetical protein [Escherichia coli]MBM2967488.1 hypothetical protein [Escherichia coli]